MGGQDSGNRRFRVGIVGSTKLTLKSMNAIKDFVDIRLVFGLTEEERKNKVNSVDLTDFCKQESIELLEGKEWKALASYDLDFLITLGDSRIIPAYVFDEYTVYGNHGALLPDVQGGASLVWGRMLNTGRWGVTIFELDEKIDSGDILVLKPFDYDVGCTMEEFVDLADDKTVEGLVEFLHGLPTGDYNRLQNSKWSARVRRHTDSLKASTLLMTCVDNSTSVYMPSRTPDDGIINPSWTEDFKRRFKLANSYPYPNWREK